MNEFLHMQIWQFMSPKDVFGLLLRHIFFKNMFFSISNLTQGKHIYCQPLSISSN